MEKKTERVELVVLNKPGVLGRVAGHIRHEGWNIKRLTVDENVNESGADSGGTSFMEIDVEGTHTKLAQVMDRILNLDCVISIAMIQNGEKAVRRRTQERIADEAHEEKTAKVSAKPESAFRILAINPGSTSTKFGLFDDDFCILSKTIRHDSSYLNSLGSILNQKEFRKNCIMQSVKESDVDFSSIDAIAGRGGLLKPIESGVYAINKKMLEDLQSATAAIHASALGAIIASEIASSLGVNAYVVDPIVVDEMDRNAKLTGMPGIERSSVFHALNQKAIARRLASQLGKPYENSS